MSCMQGQESYGKDGVGMSAKVMIEVMDAIDGTEHKFAFDRIKCCLDGYKPIGKGFTPLPFAMIWYRDKHNKVVLVRAKGYWAKIMLKHTIRKCPDELNGEFEFCEGQIFRRKV